MVGRSDHDVWAAAEPRVDGVQIDTRLDRERTVHLRNRQLRVLGAERAADELGAPSDRARRRAERRGFNAFVVGHAVWISQ